MTAKSKFSDDVTRALAQRRYRDAAREQTDDPAQIGFNGHNRPDVDLPTYLALVDDLLATIVDRFRPRIAADPGTIAECDQAIYEAGERVFCARPCTTTTWTDPKENP